MDNNSKTASYNNSAYAARMAEKQALYNNSNYGQKQALSSSAISSLNKANKINQYTLPNGKILMRMPKANRIDFKSVFAGLSDDIVDNTILIKKFKMSSDNMLASFVKQNQSYKKS